MGACGVQNDLCRRNEQDSLYHRRSAQPSDPIVPEAASQKHSYLLNTIFALHILTYIETCDYYIAVSD